MRMFECRKISWETMYLRPSMDEIGPVFCGSLLIGAVYCLGYKVDQNNGFFIGPIIPCFLKILGLIAS